MNKRDFFKILPGICLTLKIDTPILHTTIKHKNSERQRNGASVKIITGDNCFYFNIQTNMGILNGQKIEVIKFNIWAHIQYGRIKTRTPDDELYDAFITYKNR